MNPGYHSQFGQDKYLDEEIFGGSEGLFFVEIGSADPIEMNNTYFLEQHRKWKGILVEARPSACEKLSKSRDSEVINACISSDEGRSIFLDYGYLAGLCKYMGETEHRYIEQYNSSDKDVRAFWIKTQPLGSILKERNISQVQLLGIDVEGAEIAVLETVAFDELFIDVIMAESNSRAASEALDSFLLPRGFNFRKTLGADRIYINAKSVFK